MKAKTLKQQALEFIEKIKTLQISANHGAKSFSAAPGVVVTPLDPASLKGLPVPKCGCGQAMKPIFAAAVMVQPSHGGYGSASRGRAERSFAE